MPAKLIAINGPLVGQRFGLDGDSISFGREPDNLLVIPDDSVSSMHGVFLFHKGAWHVHDRGSTNGIRINGRDIFEGHLHHGDILEIGLVQFQFEFPRAESSSSIEAPSPGLDATIYAPPPSPPASTVATHAPPPAKGGRRKAHSAPKRERLQESQVDAILYWTRPNALFFWIAIAAIALTAAALWYYIEGVL